MTRAKDVLTLSFAHNRRMWGRSSPSVMSRFLKEIPEKLLAPVGIPSGTETAGQSPDRGISGNVGKPRRRGTPARFRNKRDSGFPTTNRPSLPNAQPPDFLQPGKIVKHRTFGLGSVVSVDGNPPALRVTVNFRIVGRKTVVQRFAKLEPA